MFEDSESYRTLRDYCAHLGVAGDREATARGYRTSLGLYVRFMATDHNPRHGQADATDPTTATPATIEAFRHWLAVAYRTVAGRHLARSSQRTKLAAVKSYYGWLYRRGHIANDPAAGVDLPLPEQRRTVHKDHLTLQEATALIATAAERVHARPADTYARAKALCDLAVLGYGLASGRRVAGIRGLQLDQINWTEREIRVDREKGKPGRVLPIADWCLGLLRRYLAEGRPHFVATSRAAAPWCFLSRTGGQLGGVTVGKILRAVLADTITGNPDLVDLPYKHLTPHSLRVTFASSLLFANGCPIRSVNELMLHDKLSTTARYTPIDLADLRRSCLTAHPRA